MIERLLRNPRRFGFFQATRLLEREQRVQNARKARSAATEDVATEQWGLEPVLFRAEPSLAFSSSEIVDIRPIEQDERHPRRLVEMVVSFFGLTGPAGVLPQHYSSLLVGLRSTNQALRAFFDLFNHRLIALFARAWAKYRLPIAFEGSARPGEDPITTALRGIIGLPVDTLFASPLLADRWMLYYGGLFAHTPRCADGLEGMLGDYFGVPVKVQPFRGRWLDLGVEDRTALPSERNLRGAFCQLDETATLGDRVWDVQGCFRLVIGPIDYRRFLRLMPTGADLAALLELARFYVGRSLDFDIQLVLRKDEVPACRLAASEDFVPRLGWNTWVRDDDRPKDADDAVFGGEAISL